MSFIVDENAMMDPAKSQKRNGPSRSNSISPPPKRRLITAASVAADRLIDTLTPRSTNKNPEEETLRPSPKQSSSPREAKGSSPARVARTIPSPVQLNFIDQLPAASNVDTVSLGSILGDPLIRECWLFNYLFDLGFVMKHFDSDVRELVQVKVVHGSWKKEDMNGIRIDEASRRFHNIEVIKAYMPEAYGTHHSKMIILFRHDDLAQVIILTGNFIERDWVMSQAIWRSPLLPLQKATADPISAALPPLGRGPRFKHDLLAYLRSYGGRLKPLSDQLREFDFDEVKGALIASTPSKQNVRSIDPDAETLWGLPALRNVLSIIPSATKRAPEIAIQISSVASVGEKWLTSTFMPALFTTKASDPAPTAQSTDAESNSPPVPSKMSIVFPTAQEIRASLTGYSAGASIHMKTQSPAQAKQLSFLHPMLYHWDGFPSQDHLDARLQPRPPSDYEIQARKAGRGSAAPHIKTYIRFSDASKQSIDWAMVTSANLSTQAWGAAPNASGEVRICSYEIGVVVWPGLWDEQAQGNGGEAARMVPVFGSDTPPGDPEEEESKASGTEGVAVRVGWRMPYDLPLVPYARGEMPWCTTKACDEPDWMGRVWEVYGA